MAESQPGTLGFLPKLSDFDTSGVRVRRSKLSFSILVYSRQLTVDS
jgi:hypothetical protein